MLLAAGDIVTNQLFFKGGTHRRPSSVDLTIDRMFNEQGDDLGASYLLKPGEMVMVTTTDVFNLPSDVTALVSCKTTLTHQGVWAITVGIVDPCYVGPISTTLVNFGSNARLLKRDTAFLRAAFFKHKDTGGCPAKNPDDETRAYLTRAQQMSVGFKRTFLDQHSIEKAAGDKAFDRMKNGALVWAGLIALIFTGMQTLSIAADRYVFSPSLVSASSERLQSISERLDAIEGRLSEDQGSA